eukprot:scaffold32377_cov34-Tisochrysis_lutea.AAC.2
MPSHLDGPRPWWPLAACVYRRALRRAAPWAPPSASSPIHTSSLVCVGAFTRSAFGMGDAARPFHLVAWLLDGNPFAYAHPHPIVHGHCAAHLYNI